MATEKRLIDVRDCPCDGCKANPCGHPARCVKFALWLNKTVDAVEVVHGRWIPTNSKCDCTCSVCNTEFDNIVNDALEDWNYCPNCGAKMDGDGNG